MTVIVFGSINLDLVFPVSHLPAPGETVIGPTVRLEPGGKGANQAVAAAREGARVAFAGAVGRDPLAEHALSGLRFAGVDLSRLAVVDAPTGCAAIGVDADGRNQILVAAGANRAARASQVADSDLGPGTVLLLQGECDVGETAAVAQRARDRGTRVVLNLAPFVVLPREALAAASILVVNETEAAALAGHLGVAAEARMIASALGMAVVVTLGAEGAALVDAGAEVRVPALPVPVIDTTGAGDALCGVLAAGLARGLALPAALRRAVVAASLACTRPGAQSALPDRAEIDSALEGAFIRR
ncbi:MAG: ribokinase [Elioraea sp.]|nr:ribokinase [Elioraea sp.]